MLTTKEYEEVLGEQGEAGLYVDPTFSNPKVYGQFLKDLHGRGMIEFGLSASITLGMFFCVEKE